MLKKMKNKPIIITVHGHDWNRRNVLTHKLDALEEQTLSFDYLGKNRDEQTWIIEEYKNTNLYFIKACTTSGNDTCITAMSPDFTWQAVTLAKQNEMRKEQLWRIHRCNRGFFRFNNVKHMDKYLSKVPGVNFDVEQNIAVISPPHEIIRIGYVLLNWQITFIQK